MPSQRSSCRSDLQSNASSATNAVGFCFGLPGLPATAGISMTKGKQVFTSC